MREEAKIWDAIEGIRTAMFVSRGKSGLHARPMSAIVRREEGRIWFLTSRETAKTCEIEANPDVSVTFSNGTSTHVAVNGRATLVDERAHVKDLWSIAAQAFYPDGPTDPDIVAIKVEPEIAELWDAPATPVALVKMAAALVTRTSANSLGENVKVALG